MISKSSNPLIFSTLASHLNFLIKRSIPIDYSKSVHVLDGKKGCGKSCQLSVIAHDFLAKGGIVMFESGIPMVNGSFPYSLKNNFIDTPGLSRDIIERFRKLNNLEPHAKIKDLIDKTTDSNASQVLQDLLEVLSETNHVLLLIDEINALYAKSCYHDTDSNQLGSHRLLVPNLFLKVLKSQNISSVVAQDYTNTLYPAYAFQNLVHRSGGILKPSDLNVSKDDFPTDLLPDVVVHRMENLSKDQVKEWMEVFLKEGIISKSLRMFNIFNSRI